MVLRGVLWEFTVARLSLHRSAGATMLRFSSRQRAALGATLRDLANYAAAALVFGQFVGQGTPSWSPFIAGLVFWFAAVWLGLLMEKK
jgi:hypothetical protein